MPAFLESKLKSEYGAKSDIPFKVMNSMGVMHGNQETAKGREMEAKHRRDQMMQAEAKRVTSKASRK